MTLTLTPITFLDGAGASKPVVSYYDGTSNVVAHVLLDGTGALLSPATSGKQDTANTALGAPGDAAVTNPASSASVIAALKGILTAVANIMPKGQATMANSSPVAIASDQAAVPVALTANTTGGASTFSASGASGGNALLTNTPVAVKASAGNLYGFDFVNTGSAAAYVQLFDAAAGSVTLGTTAPKLSKWVPAGGAWEEKFAGDGKITFGTAITVAATTTATGNTAPVTGILANVTFK